MKKLDDWLARGREAAIEPELQVCDAHHHLWEYPDSRYLLEEFLDDIDSGHRIVKTVYVECDQGYRNDGKTALRPVGETEKVQRIAGSAARPADRQRIAAGIVGFADLRLGAAVREALEAHRAASERFCGIRYVTGWDPSEQIRKTHTHPPPGLLADPGFRAGLACLRDYELPFDAWLYHSQFTELLELARAFPDLTIVLDHMGGPLGVGPYADKRDQEFQAWRRALAPLAACPNLYIKLGGRTMTMAGFGWHKRDRPPDSNELAEAMRPYFDTCIGLFGAARCMFESNFPLDRVSCSYATLWNAFKRASSGYSNTERAALFHDTAVHVYQL